MDLAEYLNSLTDEAEKNAFLRELLHRGFRYPFDKMEYVMPASTGRAGGYIRRKQANYTQPSLAQTKARLKFSEAAAATFGIRGVVETIDKRQISESAREVGDAIRGKTYAEKVPRQVKQLRRILEEIRVSPTFLKLESIRM